MMMALVLFLIIAQGGYWGGTFLVTGEFLKSAACFFCMGVAIWMGKSIAKKDLTNRS